VTALSQESVSEELLERARAEFGDATLVRLTMAVIVINGWNRLAVPFRADVGSYQPARAGA
jgi:alkylhydroperoxidase family enzyme